MNGSALAVIGAGLSGSLLSLNLVRRCRPSTGVLLIERNSQFGLGQAYSTGNSNHLLNVPAARMSAFSDRPLDFLSWLRRRAELDGTPPPSGAEFVPRHLFGAYVRHLLNQELRRGQSRLRLIRGEVRALRPCGNRMMLEFGHRPTLAVDAAVLALGNFLPEPPEVADRSFSDSPQYRPDPWAAGAISDLDPSAPVFLIGTGLTMVDVVISLLDARHEGPITALSRRGLLPLRHTPQQASDKQSLLAFPTSVVALLRLLRAESRRCAAAGGTWQQIVDQLRPFTQDVWQAMSLDGRRRFLRHLRPWWDIHRHRMAGRVADRIHAAQARGQLTIIAGRLCGFAQRGGAVEIAYRPRSSDRPATITAARVVNCSGPRCDYDRITDRLVGNLIHAGLARPDPLRLGLDVSGSCALLSRDGAIAPNLFAVGPLTKGAFWEITAVPDIRRQCEYLASHLADLTAPAGSGGSSPPAMLHLVEGSAGTDARVA